MTWLVVALTLAASADVTQARKFYEDGEFQAAIKVVESGVSKNKNLKDVAQLQLVRGLSYLALGQKTKARQAFNDAIRADPTLELDRRMVGPDAVELIDEARAEYPSVVKIDIEGSTGVVKVDGLEMGPPPLTMKLPVGQHSFEARGPDGRTVREDKAIPAGSSVTVLLRFPEKNATPPVAETKKPEPKQPDVKPEPVTSKPADVVTAPPPAEPEMKRSKAGLVPLIGGAVVLVAGGVLTGIAGASYGQLTGATKTAPLSAQQTADAYAGKNLLIPSYVLYGVGGAAVVAGVVMLVTMKVPAEEPPPVSVSFMPGGASVTLQGRF